MYDITSTDINVVFQFTDQKVYGNADGFATIYTMKLIAVFLINNNNNNK
jgi:hypothetical protein